MKAVKEALSPTRVKLTVEVPFEDLSGSVEAAYRKLARQVRVQGFRPGKVPPRILDQRVGRGVVLDEAVQDALPKFYAEAVREQQVDTLGRPVVDISSFADGAPLVFTAEVDVRPEFPLPDYRGLAVTVDDVSVTEEEVDEQLRGLQDRFAVLEGVERPVQPGDFVSIDLDATVDGRTVPGAQTSGLSYEVGSASLLPGLDDALTGASAGETRTVTTRLVAGEFADRDAEVTVTLRSVKRKVLPDLDDDFATTASEFDTLAELRESIRARLERLRRLDQALQARDRALQALVAQAAVPLPESVLAAEVEGRMHDLGHQLEEAGLTMQAWLEQEGKTREELDAQVREGAAASVAAQFVLDAVASAEEVSVTEAELTAQLVRRAQQAELPPQRYVEQLQQSGQLPALFAEVRRSKALALVLEQARITDASGRPVDLSALRDQAEPDQPAAAAGGPDPSAAPEEAAVEEPAPGALAAEPAPGALAAEAAPEEAGSGQA